MVSLIRFILAVTVALLTLVPHRAAAMADLATLNKLARIDLVSQGEGVRATLVFAREGKVDYTPRFFEKSVQIDIKGAFIEPAKQELDAPVPSISQVALYQMTPTTVRIRFFTDGDGRAFKNRYEIEPDGSRLVVTLHGAGAQAAPEAPRVVVEAPAAARQPMVEASLPAVPAPAPAAAAPASSPVAEPSALTEERIAEFREKTAALVHRAGDGVAETTFTSRRAAEENRAAAQAAPARDAAGEHQKSALTLFGRPAEAATLPSEGGAKKKPDFLHYDDAQLPETPSLTGAAVKMVASLSVVVGIILLLGWAARRYQRSFGFGPGASGPIRTLATGAIGMKKQIAVVEVAGEVLVLGISGEQIAMLTTIDDQETADRLRRAGGNGGGNGGSPAPRTGDELVDRLMGALPRKQGNGLRRMVDALRIGRMDGPEVAPALLNEEDESTFAGRLAAMAARDDDAVRIGAAAAAHKEQPQAAEEHHPRSHGIEVRGDAPPRSKDELLRQVTGAIRAARQAQLRPA